MNLKKYVSLTLLLCVVVNGQEHHPARFIVQLSKNVIRGEFSSTLNSNKYTIEKVLVRRLNIVSISILDNQLSSVDAVAEMRNNPLVKYAQLDHSVHLRETIPNDSLFSAQWNMHNTGQSDGLIDADIDAPEAWDITTGGLTPLGDTIVVAVVDGGCMISHPDLIANIWTNWGEIPDNGIDDDENGYVDDVHGWNAFGSNGNIPNSAHGTRVCGIVGAEGNNENMVTGVNWDVKIMPVAGSSSLTSTVLEAYGYVLDQRILYDSTNGEKGAFIVATNNSFGIGPPSSPYVPCDIGSYPLWNETYNALGEAGILSAAATMNDNINVDIIGDVPTGCDSDFLITVTRTNRMDVKETNAGYGQLTIDLGAPGSIILSTNNNGSTYYSSGTSMATPHVAGAIAFLHAGMSSGFATFNKNSPGEGALYIKQMILDGVDSLTSLTGTTVSGGRLNLFNSTVLAMNFLAADSLDPNPVANLVADTNHVFQISLTWEDPTTLFGGDMISAFVIDLFRDGYILTSIGSGTEYYLDAPVPGGQTYDYSLITRLTANDSTSFPVSINVTSAGGDCIPGDATHDNEVNVTDIIRMLQFILRYDTPDDYDMCTADVDFDQAITIIDILRTADIILGRP